MAIGPLSIIVIAYNEEKYLADVLGSLAAQTMRDFEVIVVDSNSTDGTERIARSYADRVPHFRYLKLSVTAGPGYARNRGIEIAAHERLLLLDADTRLADDFIARTSDEIERRGADVATCPLRVSEAGIISKVGAIFLNGCMCMLRPVYSSAYGACLFSTARVHMEIGGFDEEIGICEDCHYVKKTRQHGFRFCILHPPFQTSDRRARQEGALPVLAKYIRCHAWRLITGREIRKEAVHYNYGNF